ncbi:MAG: hypothetical protein GDA44_00380 [Prochloron sp. SP5CPC1]|nr:hypothetical protein [Candidatus Paraprochloron terpiosi SP5CPC1]
MQVKDLTIEEFRGFIQETVTETLEILLRDRDEDEQLKPEVVQELIESLQRTQGGEPGISANVVAKKLGLKW